MSLLHIPVRVLAANPAESQAFSEVLSGGQAGALALAGADEKPVAALVCPSGNPADAMGIPSVVLGQRREELPAQARVLAVPAGLADILEALETTASAASGLSAPRSFGGWALDPARLVVRKDEKAIALTDTEARLLACLIDAQGGIVTREILLQRVWGYRPGLDTHTLETHIYRLRKKIEADPAVPCVIVTTPDGYHFAP